MCSWEHIEEYIAVISSNLTLSFVLHMSILECMILPSYTTKLSMIISDVLDMCNTKESVRLLEIQLYILLYVPSCTYFTHYLVVFSYQ